MSAIAPVTGGGRLVAIAAIVWCAMVYGFYGFHACSDVVAPDFSMVSDSNSRRGRPVPTQPSSSYEPPERPSKSRAERRAEWRKENAERRAERARSSDRLPRPEFDRRVATPVRPRPPVSQAPESRGCGSLWLARRDAIRRREALERRQLGAIGPERVVLLEELTIARVAEALARAKWRECELP